MELRTRAARVMDHGTPQWTLGYVDAAERDARKFLTEDQYAHAVQLFDVLALEINPRISQTQYIKPIDGFYELRDKGGGRPERS